MNYSSFKSHRRELLLVSITICNTIRNKELNNLHNNTNLQLLHVSHKNFMCELFGRKIFFCDGYTPNKTEDKMAYNTI